MKRRILILFTFFVIIQTIAFAQEKKDFTPVGDNLNFTTSKFLLPQEEQVKFTKPTYEVFVKQLEELKLDKNVAIAKEIELEKVAIRNTVTKDNFATKIDELITFCISKLKGTSKEGEDGTLKAELDKIKNTALVKFIKSKDQTDEKITPPNNALESQVLDLINRISKLESDNANLLNKLQTHKHDEHGEVVFDYVKWLGFLGLILSLIALVIIFIKFRKSVSKEFVDKKMIPYIYDSIKDQFKTQVQGQGKQQNQDSANFVTYPDLNQKIESLRKELKEAINKKIEKETPINQSYQNNNNFNKEYETKKSFKDSNQVQEESFYLKMPDARGFFWNDQKTNNIDNESFYIITIEKSNPTRGRFKFIDEEKNFKKALADIDTILEPVCTIDNRQGSKIQHISDGYLKLIGDKWELDDNHKCKIRIA